MSAEVDKRCRFTLKLALYQSGPLGWAKVWEKPGRRSRRGWEGAKSSYSQNKRASNVEKGYQVSEKKHQIPGLRSENTLYNGCSSVLVFLVRSFLNKRGINTATTRQTQPIQTELTQVWTSSLFSWDFKNGGILRQIPPGRKMSEAPPITPLWG